MNNFSNISFKGVVMNKKQYTLRVGVITLLLTSMLGLGYLLGSTDTGPSAAAALAGVVAMMAPTPTPVVPVGDPIPLKSLSGLTSLDATVNINVNGMLSDKRVRGDLTATVSTNNKGSSKIVVTGPLLGDIVAQVGGSAMSLFTPSSVEIYKVPEGTYIVVKSLFDVCIKPKAANSTEAMDQMNPQKLMDMFTSKDVARGTLAGSETMNGAAVKHYVIDGPTFLAAAQNSKDKTLRTFGDSLWAAKDADLYVSSAGYPVAFQGGYSGLFEPLKFEGDFDVQIEVTGINQNTPIKLPASCNNPISQ
jgi:hypothetical protein